jgi:hypothetical protein
LVVVPGSLFSTTLRTALCWRDTVYDLIAQPVDAKRPVRISVKARTYKKGSAFVTYNDTDQFDWLAIVLLECGEDERRRLFLVPRDVSDARAKIDGPKAKTNERVLSN